MLHRVFFQLHRAKEILYKKKGEIFRVKNIVPVLVNHSCILFKEVQKEKLEVCGYTKAPKRDFIACWW